MPNAVESDQLTSILSDDVPFKSVSNALQRSGGRWIELFAVLRLFDKLIAQFPAVESRLKADEDIVHWPIFESAVCKVQSFDEGSLTRPEREAIKRFLLPAEENEESDNPEEENTEGDWAQDVIDMVSESKRRKCLPKSRYRSMMHIAPTSNIVNGSLAVPN